MNAALLERVYYLGSALEIDPKRHLNFVMSKQIQWIIGLIGKGEVIEGYIILDVPNSLVI